MTGELLPGLQAVRDFGRARAAFWADPPRGQCAETGCAETDAILYGEPLVCAWHYRATQAERGRPYPCDRCGKGSAFRDPLGREDVMLCGDCHQRNGYVPGERAMVSVIERREGFTHSKGTREKCTLADAGTECSGQVKPRGKKGVMCDKHNDPRKWMKGVQ